MIDMIEDYQHQTGIQPLCDALEVPRATLYRRRKPTEVSNQKRPSPTLALSLHERQQVLDILHSDRFIDSPPAQVYATLLDEGQYLCSARTMYRILAEQDEVRERRNMRQHPQYTKPELLATEPNQVWSWDITKLKGPQKWTYFYLYVILDIFSRYVVGWMVAPRESATLAKRLIQDSYDKQGVASHQLTVHADRGSSMTSKQVANLMADLGITKTHSRPHVSNDNPFSESQFKTLKYRPAFPSRFGSLPDARVFCLDFFDWYNTQHRHSGVAFYRPEDVHYGRTGILQKRRQKALDQAYLAHPERFVRKAPEASEPPQAVWINPPENMKTKQSELLKIRA
jgi:putative transposase